MTGRGGMQDGAHEEHLFVREFRLESGSRRPTDHRVHGFHVLILCTGGAGTLHTPRAWPVRAGALYLLPAGTPHALGDVEGLELVGVGFCPGCAVRDGLGELLEPFERVRAGAALMSFLDEPVVDRLRLLIRLLHEALGPDRSGPIGLQTRRAALTLILAEVARIGSFLDASAPPSLVADALRIIERRCLEPITLSDVAAELHRSPAYVTTKVREATGKTVQEWIISGRISEARRLLELTDEYVDVIAERVGYADVTHFIRLFRRVQGMTPAAWRRAHRRG